MTNRDVLNRKHPQEIEQMLGFLLMEYWDKLKAHGNLDKSYSSPVNVVGVYKDFLKQETLINTELYDRMYPAASEVVIDAEYKEVEDKKEPEIEDKISELITKYASKHDLAKSCGSEYIYQSDSAQVDAIELVSKIFDLYASQEEEEDESRD